MSGIRLIDANALDYMLSEAQAECKRNGGNFRFGVLSNIRENIKTIPTVDAIPVEWLKRKRKEALREGMRPDEIEAVEMVMWMWQKEQEECF